MTCPGSSLLFLCMWSIWTLGYAADCGERQRSVADRCCDFCPPGFFVKEHCSEHQQTVCSPCEDGSFADQYHFFGSCQTCHSCQAYTQKCTSTTNANCSCHPGFLCSNNVCSKCEENKCVMGEKLVRTAKPIRLHLKKYSYHCEQICTGTEYFDVTEKICKLRTQCSLLGLPELFPGNKSQNSVCDRGRQYGDFPHIILSLGFVLMSLILLVLLVHACIKNLRKLKPGDKPEAVPTTVNDFHLSKEESGLQLIIQDENKYSTLSENEEK